jgi:inosine-uridine nucleoside N-ribohydrolase
MRLIIDTDLGMGTVGSDPEDGMAILYALNAPDVRVDGLTLVQGNVPIAHSWPNAHHLLALAGCPDLPVHAGAALPRNPNRRRLQTAWLDQRATVPIDVREQLFPEHEALHLYDTLAVAAAIEPDLLETHGALVDIETSDGPAQGMTVTYRNDILREFLTGRGPNAAVAVGVDSTRFAQHLDARVADCL